MGCVINANQSMSYHCQTIFCGVKTMIGWYRTHLSCIDSNHFLPLEGDIFALHFVFCNAIAIFAKSNFLAMFNRTINIVEKELNLPEGSLLSRSILHDVCVGRYICYRYLHEEHIWSANRIAKHFNRTRKNIFRGIMVLRNQMEFDNKLRYLYSHVLEKIEDASTDAPSVD